MASHERDSALAEILQIAASRGLDPVHPPDVQHEAAGWARAPGIDDPSLVDLTHLPLCTIDEQTSQDLDQALYIEPRNGGHIVWYAIADAAWFVRPGRPLFREALRRGATYYLPGLVVTMLPRVLCEDIVSLAPGEDRRALVFEVHLDPDGRVLGSEVHRARVRSRVKTWFSAVQDFLDGTAGVPGGDEAIAESLRALKVVGERRMEVAEERHVVHLRRAEVAVEVGPAGLRFVAETDIRDDVERYNEQISLLCNIEGARFLVRDGPTEDVVQAIYRVHQPPTPERLQQLAHTIHNLVKRHHLDPHTWDWKPSGQSLATYLERLPHTSPEGRVARAIHRQAMLSNGRAAFTGKPGMHYGVGAEVYARFTAPMREIVGIFVHKETWEKLGDAPASENRSDEEVRAAVIEASNKAHDLQRQLDDQVNRLVLDQLFADDLRKPQGQRPERRGTVMGVQRDKVHVQLDDPPIDVKVYFHHLAAQGGPVRRTGDRLEVVREQGGAVVCRVGDAVRVRALGPDVERDRWTLALRGD